MFCRRQAQLQVTVQRLLLQQSDFFDFIPFSIEFGRTVGSADQEVPVVILLALFSNVSVCFYFAFVSESVSFAQVNML